MSSIMLLLFSLLALVSSTIASNCSWPGVFIDIHERLVDGRTDWFQYGFFIGMGNPSQNNSLWPAITHNETTFVSPDFCAAGDVDCTNSTHGFVSTETSSTWQTTPNYQSLDDPSTQPNATRIYGQDTLNLWTHYFDPSPATGTYVQNMPLTVLSNYTSKKDPYFNAATFGLGPASVALDRLVAQGSIPSKSYGLYIGAREPRAGGTQNGSIVLGGYDSGRFKGPLKTYPQVPAVASNAFSPFKVSVSQVSLVTDDGSSIGLVPDAGFDAYITTSQFPIQFPTQLTNRLARALAASPANNDDNTLAVPNGFKGNMTITLSNNITFTFDSSWISNASNISPFSAVPYTGASDDSNSTSSSDDLPILLGAAFLEQVYLFVQYDTTPPQFSVAQADPYGLYVMPEPLCANSKPVPAPTVNMNKFVQKGLIGATLGGIIGGSGLIILIWMIFGRKIVAKVIAKRQIKLNDIEKGAGGKKSSGNFKSSMKYLKFPSAKNVHFDGAKESRPNKKSGPLPKSPAFVTEKRRTASSYSSTSSDSDSPGKNENIEMTDYKVTSPENNASQAPSVTTTRFPSQPSKPTLSMNTRNLQPSHAPTSNPQSTPYSAVEATPTSAHPLLNPADSLPSHHRRKSSTEAKNAALGLSVQTDMSALGSFKFRNSFASTQSRNSTASVGPAGVTAKAKPRFPVIPTFDPPPTSNSSSSAGSGTSGKKSRSVKNVSVSISGSDPDVSSTDHNNNSAGQSQEQRKSSGGRRTSALRKMFPAP